MMYPNGRNLVFNSAKRKCPFGKQFDLLSVEI